jgi:hypothetical protein
MHKSDQKCLAMQEPSTHDIRCALFELVQCGWGGWRLQPTVALCGIL